ncbi:hypothetical protein V6N11_000994 [Hibiscus sabdariffa]|uniref:Secreted protein n=1 Tax=Hibiscus sabdariffa TaxID=183260 RepID=A0ABR2RZ72_9ROSI
MLFVTVMFLVRFVDISWCEGKVNGVGSDDEEEPPCTEPESNSTEKWSAIGSESSSFSISCSGIGSRNITIAMILFLSNITVACHRISHIYVARARLFYACLMPDNDTGTYPHIRIRVNYRFDNRYHVVMCRRREEVCRTVSSFVMQRNAKLHIGSSSSMVCCRLVAMAIMGLSLASFWGNGYRLTVLTRPTHRPFCSG